MIFKFKNKAQKSMYILAVFTLFYCEVRNTIALIKPDIITESTLNDTDDPAIWVHPTDRSQSIVFGTDKETNGAIYAFNLEGKVLEDKTIRNIKRPNNVDVAYGFQMNDTTTTDILVFTEREKMQLRIFSVPEMKPIDAGGFKVFEDEENSENKLPMGIAIYKSPIDTSFYAIISRKSGPKQGYLYQYKLVREANGIQAKLVRKFGDFSGKKEIEAIAVDAEMGFIYYADEGHGIRKYYAEPSKGNKEISCFGAEYFKNDIEGIAIAKFDDNAGYLIVSDQQRGQFNVFDRTTNKFINAVNLSTLGTDGCEVVTIPLNEKFKSGLFVAMNEEKNFYFYDLDKVLK
ncbi:hypothetical protein PI23P_07780 [Polaribacter irgensii 23-P]|uniref:BPP domain-containing protein n=1 Tax=Polaribacter irgensii 23-P TaxID=313594 RepID=A4BZB5_9FLAO|nr:phytase [Polaribacter irgensii]EAR12508.1 hypothetical protein PI23P_07780 [Polaribacter irgensii 23-P]